MTTKTSELFGLREVDFTFEGREALIVFPETKPNGKWMIKMEYYNAFPTLEAELLSRGWHLAYLRNENRWGTDGECDIKARFVEYVSREYGLEKKVTCIGMSCGGICSVNFASRYPELVSFLYLDAPVMNLLSCPMGYGDGIELDGGNAWFEIESSYGFTKSSLLTYREHPIDRIPILAEYKIPVALVHGDSDTVVPYHENGLILEKYYREHGLPLYTECKVGVGHHPHGPIDVKRTADFIEKNAL